MRACLRVCVCVRAQEEDITLQEFVAFTSEFEDTQLEDILWWAACPLLVPSFLP